MPMRLACGRPPGSGLGSISTRASTGSSTLIKSRGTGPSADTASGLTGLLVFLGPFFLALHERSLDFFLVLFPLKERALKLFFLLLALDERALKLFFLLLALDERALKLFFLLLALDERALKLFLVAFLSLNGSRGSNHSRRGC